MSPTRWKITAPEGYAIAWGATEGQAWLAFMQRSGRFLDGWWLVGAVEYLRKDGYRAVEGKTTQEECD